MFSAWCDRANCPDAAPFWVEGATGEVGLDGPELTGRVEPVSQLEAKLGQRVGAADAPLVAERVLECKPSWARG